MQSSTAAAEAGLGWNRYEAILDGHAHDSACPLAAALAVASNRVRTAHREDCELRRRAIRDVAAGVLAPALIAFSLWLLDRAQSLKLRRLCFLSRDGQLLLNVTRQVADRLGIDIECAYVYSSRQSWVPGCMTEISYEQLEWAFEDTLFLSVRTQTGRLNIDPFEIEWPLKKIGFPPAKWDVDLSIEERRRLQHAMLNDERIVAALKKSIANSRHMLLGYIEQEKLLSNASCAMVDLGWHATTQKALARLLFEAKPSELTEKTDALRVLHGFYFALCGDAPKKLRDHIHAEGFFLDEWHDRGMVENDLPQLGTIMETACSANHDTVLRYRQENGRVVPVLRNMDMSSLEDWGLDVLRTSISETVAACDFSEVTADAAPALCPVIHELLKKFWFEPRSIEAKTWGRFPLGDRMGHVDGEIFMAKPFGWRSFIPALRRASIDLPHGCIWYWGCHKLTPKPMMFALRAIKKIGELIKKTTRR